MSVRVGRRIEKGGIIESEGYDVMEESWDNAELLSLRQWRCSEELIFYFAAPQKVYHSYK